MRATSAYHTLELRRCLACIFTYNYDYHISFSVSKGRPARHLYLG